MIVKVVREKPENGAIPSVLYVDGVQYCYGLENDLYKIPTGSYPLYSGYSEKFGKNKLYLSVPGRTGIMFHGGNTKDSSKGCLLVGRNRSGATISGDCSDDLLKLVNDAYGRGERIVAQVTDGSKKWAYALITAGVLALVYFAVKG